MIILNPFFAKQGESKIESEFAEHKNFSAFSVFIGGFSKISFNKVFKHIFKKYLPQVRWKSIIVIDIIIIFYKSIITVRSIELWKWNDNIKFSLVLGFQSVHVVSKVAIVKNLYIPKNRAVGGVK